MHPSSAQSPAFTRLSAIEVVRALVTDDGIRDRDAQAFDLRGIEVLVAT